MKDIMISNLKNINNLPKMYFTYNNDNYKYICW